MAVLPINTKIRGPAPISCKSPTEKRSYSLDRREYLLKDHWTIQEYPRALGLRDEKGEIELEGQGRRRRDKELIYSRP